MFRARLASLATSVLLAAGGLAAPARADIGSVVPETQQVVGGCQVGFDAAGNASLRPSQTRPCVGVAGLAVSSVGDLRLDLDTQADDAQTRLTVSPGLDQVDRGITAGATRGPRTITLRFYDDTRGTRLDLRRSDMRARLAGSTTTVGWIGAAPYGLGGRDLGINYYGPYRDRAATGTTTVQGGCVIRFSTAGPWIHANSTHHCTGVSSVGVSSAGRLVLNASAEQRGSIINLSADPDETLTSRGIVAGTSTSTSQIYVQLYDTQTNRPLNLTRAADRYRVSGNLSNIWFSWTKTTRRPGAVNATYTPATDKYGPYISGSAAQGSVEQTGCEIRFSSLNGQPLVWDSSSSKCSGIKAVQVSTSGTVQVTSSPAATAPVVGSSTVSSRSLTDYGIRAGLSGGLNQSYYRMYSIRLNRPLDLRVASDRALLQRSGSSLYLGWTRQD